MLTKTERDKKRALNEARRAGKVLPEIDQNGNVINPHIPDGSYFRELLPEKVSESQYKGNS